MEFIAIAIYFRPVEARCFAVLFYLPCRLELFQRQENRDMQLQVSDSSPIPTFSNFQIFTFDSTTAQQQLNRWDVLF